MTYARHESPSNSVVRASDRCAEGHGFDSRRGLRFFLCPTLATRWIFHLFLFRLRAYNLPSFFIYHLQRPSTLLILAVCRTCFTTNSVNMTYARHESPSSSVVRASDRCTEGHGFDSRRGLRFFLCPTLATCWIFYLFLTLYMYCVKNNGLKYNMQRSHQHRTSIKKKSVLKKEKGYDNFKDPLINTKVDEELTTF